MDAILERIFGTTDDYYAREADRIARGPQLYGGNAAIVQLRCFKYYHPDQGSFLTDPEGRERWLGPKASRVYAILHRLATSGERSTMTSIANEAMCCVSTVSRAVTRLQAFGFFAIDVSRGRHGGITVKLATVARQFRAHIDAAWRRIRSWINVASRSTVTEEGTWSVRTAKDATFIGRGGVLAPAVHFDAEIASLGPGDDDRHWRNATPEERERYVRDAAAWRAGLARSLAAVGCSSVEEYLEWMSR